MGASSVTGVSGPGASQGKYKPELHCGGCGCGGDGDETPTRTPNRPGCVVNSKGTQKTSINVGSSNGIKVC
jgi:hypothetical protein